MILVIGLGVAAFVVLVVLLALGMCRVAAAADRASDEWHRNG